MTARRVQAYLWGRLKSNWRIACPNFTPRNWHECDVFAVTKAGYGIEYEIKLTVADFKADATKLRRVWKREDGFGYKQHEHRKHDRLGAHDVQGPSMFWYVVPMGLLDRQAVPEWAGVLHFNPNNLYFSQSVRAPRLHRQPVDQAVIQQMNEAFYWRFWHERLGREIPREQEEPV